MPELLPALSKRRARRAFDSRAVGAAEQDLLWQAVSVAPSHGNTQPVRVMVARDPAVRRTLERALSEGNRGWASAAPLLAALCVLPGHDSPQQNSDGTTREMWAFHGGIAMGNLLAQATALGLTAHPMAGFDEPAVREAFAASSEVRVMAVVAIGWPGAVESLPEDLQGRETAPQDRLSLDRLVVVDRWAPEHGVSARELRRASR